MERCHKKPVEESVGHYETPREWMNIGVVFLKSQTLISTTNLRSY